MAKKVYAREFFKQRINYVILELVKHIPFKKFLDKFIFSHQKIIRFYDLKDVLF